MSDHEHGQGSMTSGDWTPEAAAAIELCKNWADEVAAQMPCNVYLFGSAIYESGDQFDAQQSDLDLVILFQEALDATERAQRLLALRQLKFGLELQLVPTLHRTNCSEPGVSVVPITILELNANIHKSGARRFFDKNIYLDLDTERESIGLPNAGTCSIADEARQALEYVQKVRNEFLAISANGMDGIVPFDGVDPLPKSLARVAAQLIPDAAVGAWYDTRFGLEYLFEELSRRRSESDTFGHLYRKISIRRGGRGRRLPLSDYDQILLAEILYDRAAAAPLEPMATWEIRFGGAPPTPAENQRLLRNLQSLVPDAQIMGIFEGSIIVRLRSSKRSYLTLKRCEELGILPAFFEVSEVTVSSFHDYVERAGFRRTGVIDRIVERIASWRPLSRDDMEKLEAKLVEWLESWLREDHSLAGALVSREAFIANGERSLRADILMRFVDMGQDQRVVIELLHLRSRKSFFDQIDRVRRIFLPVILVVLGTPDQLGGLQEDFRNLSTIQSAIRVVPIPLDNG